MRHFTRDDMQMSALSFCLILQYRDTPSSYIFFKKEWARTSPSKSGKEPGKHCKIVVCPPPSPTSWKRKVCNALQALKDKACVHFWFLSVFENTTRLVIHIRNHSLVEEYLKDDASMYKKLFALMAYKEPDVQPSVDQRKLCKIFII